MMFYRGPGELAGELGKKFELRKMQLRTQSAYASELKIVQQEITEINATITDPTLGATPAVVAAVTFKTTPDTQVGSVQNPDVT